MIIFDWNFDRKVDAPSTLTHVSESFLKITHLETFLEPRWGLTGTPSYKDRYNGNCVAVAFHPALRTCPTVPLTSPLESFQNSGMDRVRRLAYV